MNTSSPARPGSGWLVAAVLALVAILMLGYALSPQLRLHLRGQSLTTPARVAVNAHRYDADWFDAARAGRVDILQALHQAGYPIDRQDHSGYSAVILAAYDHQPAALAYLRSQGANLCLGDKHGNTALMGTLYKGYLDIADDLLRADCDVEQSNHAGETALDFAVLFGRAPILHQLLQRHANIEHVDAAGHTPLQIALGQDNQAMVAVLRQAGARY